MSTVKMLDRLIMVMYNIMRRRKKRRKKHRRKQRELEYHHQQLKSITYEQKYH